ncbi:MAG: sel1 repeat family protein, partial [Lachnospiraceae bacterium]|nr:sel1 repeat family protein [Lachnospiraceae bacterium]
KGKSSFATNEEYRAYQIENISKCEDWFWRAFRGGVYYAGNNLRHYYTKGDRDLIAPCPEKAADLWRIGAEYGYPNYQYNYALELKEKKSPDTLGWYKLAAEGGEGDAWYFVGIAYQHGNGAPKDPAYAAKCFEKGLSMACADGTRGFNANALGALYCESDVVPRNYDRAFQLLSYAYSHGSTWGVRYLGKCYFRGWGTAQDFGKARELLEKAAGDNREVFFMLGYIYGRGLGVPADIPKAVFLLQKAGDDPEAKEELLRYKKTLFGKWVLR